MTGIAPPGQDGHGIWLARFSVVCNAGRILRSSLRQTRGNVLAALWTAGLHARREDTSLPSERSVATSRGVGILQAEVCEDIAFSNSPVQEGDAS